MIELITGSPGAGKTCYGVSQRLMAEAAREFVVDEDTAAVLGVQAGQRVKRRVVVAGVRDLVIPHERLPHKLTGDDVPTREVERWNKMRDDVEDTPIHLRLPGQPPVPCQAIIQNWWLWAQPGDLIFVDEAQHALPKMTLGRRLPFWVEAFQTHRHYAVDFIFVTQDPTLLDTAVRKLVGLHRHVRSVMGSPICTIYTWDHASNPERFHLASKSVWRRRRAYYKLYRSAVTHLKPPSAGRGGLVIVLVLLCVLGYLAWSWQRKHAAPVPALTAPALAPAADAPQAAHTRALAAAAPVADREPYAGLGVHLAGSVVGDDGRPRTWFALSVDGRTVATVSDAELLRAGYAWRTRGLPCAGVLIWGSRERAVTCDTPGGQQGAAIAPMQPASHQPPL